MSTDTLYVGRDWAVEHDKRVKVDGAELEYTVLGAGEPVLLIHCTSIADGLVAPLVKFSPWLLERYQFISYHRAGYGGSTLEKDSLTIQEMAGHAKQLLDHLGVEKAHIVSYSFGGVVGFQFLLSYPERAASSALLEPFLLREDPDNKEANDAAIMSGISRYQSGDKRGGAMQYMAAVCGPDYLSAVETTCPLDTWDRVEECADTTFGVDFAALANWDFAMSKADALYPSKPQMPVLAVLGQESEAALPGFREVQSFLMNWLPQAERAGIIGAAHGMQIMNPTAVAEALDSFFTRHPLD